MKAGPLDESLIIQSFKDADLLADPANAVLQEAGERPAASRRDGEEPTASRRDGEEPAADEAAVPTDGTAKGKSRRRRGSYDEVYLKRRELKTRQPVYISQEIHRHHQAGAPAGARGQGDQRRGIYRQRTGRASAPAQGRDRRAVPQRNRRYTANRSLKPFQS